MGQVLGGLSDAPEMIFDHGQKVPPDIPKGLWTKIRALQEVTMKKTTHGVSPIKNYNGEEMKTAVSLFSGYFLLASCVVLIGVLVGFLIRRQVHKKKNEKSSANMIAKGEAGDAWDLEEGEVRENMTELTPVYFV